MPNKYNLRYLSIAQDDLVSILDWIAQDSASRAKVFVDSVSNRIGRLEHHPLMGRMPRNEKLKKLGYRVLVVENYLVFYVQRGRAVEIHRVLHGSRNFDEIL